jgi:hypothetical protein
MTSVLNRYLPSKNDKYNSLGTHPTEMCCASCGFDTAFCCLLRILLSSIYAAIFLVPVGEAFAFRALL